MSGWIFVALLLGETLAFVLAIRWVGRAWLADRWSARRVAIASGLLTTLVIGVPFLVSMAGDTNGLPVALLLLAFLAGIVIANNLVLWTYAERHGVKDNLRRLIERRQRPG